MVQVRIETTHDQLTGFQHWWCKFVRGFNPANHCINTLVGPRQWVINPRMPTNQTVEVQCSRGEILYFCGVATPWSWANNLHLVGVAADAVAEMPLYNGGRLIVEGMQRIEFDDKIAVAQFVHLGRSFVTCRNFQFAAHAAHNHLIPTVTDRQSKESTKTKNGVLFE